VECDCRKRARKPAFSQGQNWRKKGGHRNLLQDFRGERGVLHPAEETAAVRLLKSALRYHPESAVADEDSGVSTTPGKARFFASLRMTSG